MLSTRSSDLHHKTFLIKQDDKFFSRLLSREFSMSRNNNKIGSFRGLPSSVPFVWESQPGTPKHRFHSSDVYTDPLPPLTPPPSFFSTTAANGSKSGKFKRQSSLNALFHKLNILKKSSSSSSSSSLSSSTTPTISSQSISSSSTCSLSSGSSSMTRTRRTRFGSWGGYSSSSSGKLDEEDGNFNNGSPTSTLCFMIRSKQNKNMDLQKNGSIHAHELIF